MAAPRSSITARALARRSPGRGTDRSPLDYAAFHHAVALLLSVGVEPRRHRALPGLLATHFAGELAPGDVQAIARLATDRDLADHERAWQADRTTLERAFADAEPLIERFRALLAAGGWPPGPGTT